ncbi:MAG: hypothetical protein AAF730_09990 [Bacteroidota bacterium]
MNIPIAVFRVCDPPVEPLDPIAMAQEAGIRTFEYQVMEYRPTGACRACGCYMGELTAYVQVAAEDEKRAVHNGFALSGPPPPEE